MVKAGPFGPEGFGESAAEREDMGIVNQEHFGAEELLGSALPIGTKNDTAAPSHTIIATNPHIIIICDGYLSSGRSLVLPKIVC